MSNTRGCNSSSFRLVVLLSLKLLGIVGEELLQSSGGTVKKLVDASGVDGAAVAPHALEEVAQALPPQRQTSALGRKREEGQDGAGIEPRQQRRA